MKTGGDSPLRTFSIQPSWGGVAWAFSGVRVHDFEHSLELQKLQKVPSGNSVGL